MSANEISTLKLPPLVKCHVPNAYESKMEMRGFFESLAKQHQRLPDPMKTLLYHSAMYGDDRETREASSSLVPCFRRHLVRQEPPCEVHHSPPPDHVSHIRRSIFNEKSTKGREVKVSQRATPMATIFVRWQPCNHLCQHLVLEELSKFGTIESVTVVGRSSALVVFQNITAACKVITAYPGHHPDRSIHCYWYNKFMRKKQILTVEEMQK